MLLKLENKYDTINKTYFKEMKYVDWFSWNKYNGDDDELVIPFFVGGTVFLFMAAFVNAIAFIPSFIFFAMFIVNFTRTTDKEYIELNSSYLVQLKGDDKPKYYSKWYLDNTDRIEYKTKTYKESVYTGSLKYTIREIKKIKNSMPENSIILSEEVKPVYYQTIEGISHRVIRIVASVPISTFQKVERESDRKHWKNNIPENRILTWSEYKKYKKGKMKEQELLKQAEYIKEFKEYYGLEAKEIEEIIK